MTLTLTPRVVDEDGNFKIVSSALYVTLTSITLDGSYLTASGGIPLTPAQLGFTGAVFFGVATVRTSVVTASPGNGVLNCATPQSPKLKLQAATGLAELADAAGTGAVVDVLAWGY